MCVPTASKKAREKEEHEKNVDITLKMRNEKRRNVHRVRKRNFDPCNDQLAPTAIKSRSKNAQTLNAQTPCPHPSILHDASKFSS